MADPLNPGAGPRPAQFTVRRNEMLGRDLTVHYHVGGTARPSFDYETLPGTVVIPAGQAIATIDVVPIADGTFEDEFESVDITIVPPPPAAAGNQPAFYAPAVSAEGPAAQAGPAANVVIADQPPQVDPTELQEVIYPERFRYEQSQAGGVPVTREFFFINEKAYEVQVVTLLTTAQLDEIVAEQVAAGRTFEQAVYDDVWARLEANQSVDLEVPSVVENAAVTRSIIRERNSVGAPGRWESLIPFWGSARAAVHDFQTGNWHWAVLNTFLAVSDIFLIKAVATSVVKGLVKVPVSAAQLAAREAMVADIATNLEKMTAAEFAIDVQAEAAARLSAEARATHKAARWAKYQENARLGKNANLDYERWSVKYETAVTNAGRANRAVDTYHARIGWGQRELETEVEGVVRRLDIGDPVARRGVEYKTGKQSLTSTGKDGKVGGSHWELERDRILVERGWDIQWVFEGTASKPLLNALDNAGIPAFDHLGNPLNNTARGTP